MTWFIRLWRKLTLAHGAGGRETKDLVEKVIRGVIPESYWKVNGGTGLDILDDSALIPVGGVFLAVTIDSYTVKPYFFPGGDLGILAASGTINDLLMAGAKPIAALDAIVAEEGFKLEDLIRILESYSKTMTENGVSIIGGDFKVMPRGDIDGVLISSAGIGVVEGKPIRDDEIRAGDKIIVSGYVGDHGAAILASQQDLGVSFNVKSDVKPLTDLMLPLLEEYRDYIHGAGDPTRGGLAMLLNDWAALTGTVIVVNEAEIPVREQVREYAEMLGIDPLSLASEGVAVLAVDPAKADEILEFIQGLGYREAAIIGEVYKPKNQQHAGRVLMKSVTGGLRILEPPSGEIVPRIC